MCFLFGHSENGFRIMREKEKEIVSLGQRNSGENPVRLSLGRPAQRSHRWEASQDSGRILVPDRRRRNSFSPFRQHAAASHPSLFRSASLAFLLFNLSSSVLSLGVAPPPGYILHSSSSSTNESLTRLPPASGARQLCFRLGRHSSAKKKEGEAELQVPSCLTSIASLSLVLGMAALPEDEQLPFRILAEAEGSSTYNPTDAVIFVGLCLVLGIACRHLLRGTRVPYTVALLVLGIALGSIGSISPSRYSFCFHSSLFLRFTGVEPTDRSLFF